MKAVISSVIFAALAGLVNAKAHFTNSNFDGIEGGSTFEITWADADGPVTLTLKNGDSNDLKTVQVLTNGASGESFLWSVDSSLPTGQYALEIEDDSDEPNFSAQFQITGTDPVSDEVTSSSASASATASSSSSSSISFSSAAVSTSSSVASTSSSSTSTESSSTETSSAESSTTTSSSSSSSSAKPTVSKASSTAKISSSASIGTMPRPSSSSTLTSSASSTSSTVTAHTKVPDANDAHSMAAPIVPGLLALLGAALL